MDFNTALTAFLEKYPALNAVKEELIRSYELIVYSYSSRKKVLVCGNGGSAADSEHIVGELMKGFEKHRPLPESDRRLLEKTPHGAELAEKLQKPLRAISLVSQSGVISACANDVDPALVFAQQVWGYGDEGDVLIALSTSGNSKNVVYAAEAAKALGVKTIAITGEKESALSSLCDITLRLPAQSPKDVQELTLPVYHFLCLAVENSFFTE